MANTSVVLVDHPLSLDISLSDFSYTYLTFYDIARTTCDIPRNSFFTECDWSLQHWNGADSETKHNHDGQGVVSMLVACLKTHLTFQSRDILCSHADWAAPNPSLHATKVTSDLRL